jgi:hypothetical protein
VVVLVPYELQNAGPPIVRGIGARLEVVSSRPCRRRAFGRKASSAQRVRLPVGSARTGLARPWGGGIFEPRVTIVKQTGETLSLLFLGVVAFSSECLGKAAHR